MATISIFGGGAWGRALAFAFSQKNEVKIISRKNLCNLAPNIIQVDTKEGLKSEFFIIAIATNALRDFAESKEGKSLIVEHGEIYILEKDIDYIFKTYNVEIIEYVGLFFERNE